jgi:hypothetical protein
VCLSSPAGQESRKITALAIVHNFNSNAAHRNRHLLSHYTSLPVQRRQQAEQKGLRASKSLKHRWSLEIEKAAARRSVRLWGEQVD